MQNVRFLFLTEVIRFYNIQVKLIVDSIDPNEQITSSEKSSYRLATNEPQ